MTKILIVEDELNIRETLVDILEASDYMVIEANNGLIGSIKAVKEKPDLIISDISMPEMDGFEMLEALNGCMEEMLVPPFIFLTAKVEKSDMRKGMKLGADDYITKPFKTAELLETIKVKLEKRIKVKDKILSQERSQISSELHDSVQQLLVASYMGFEGIKDKISLLDPNDQVVFKSAFELLNQANNDLRKYAHNIGQNEMIDNIEIRLQLMADSLRKTSEMDFRVVCSLSDPIPPKVQSQLYRISQEAVCNLLKHAQATATKIYLSSDVESILLRIIDNGIGFEDSQVSHGMGLTSLTKRVSEIGGKLDIKSEVGAGTEIRVEVKYE